MASDSQMWKYVFVRRSFSEEDKVRACNLCFLGRWKCLLLVIQTMMSFHTVDG